LGGKLSGVSRSGRRWSTKLREMRSGKLSELYEVVVGMGKERPSAAAADDDEILSDLKQLVKGNRAMEGKVSTAAAWCREQEIDSVATLIEAEMVEELIAELKLQKASATVLRKRLDKFVAANRDEGSSLQAQGAQMSGRL